MARDNVLKVEPARLSAAANSFQSMAASVRGDTSQMMQIVENLCKSWKGDASTAYLNKFRGLDGDMQQIQNRINEYVNDLRQIFNLYRNQEASATGTINSLSNDLISG